MNQPAHQATAAENSTINDFLDLPEDRRRVLRWMQGQTSHSFGAIVAFLQQSDEAVRGLLDELQQQGFVKAIATADGEPQYQVHFTSMRRQRHQQSHSTNSASILDALIEDD